MVRGGLLGSRKGCRLFMSPLRFLYGCIRNVRQIARPHEADVFHWHDASPRYMLDDNERLVLVVLELLGIP